MSNGYNVGREIIGGVGSSHVRNHQVENIVPSAVILRAVVVEVLYDPDSLSSDEKNSLKTKVSNPEFVDMAPPNSLLVRVVSNGHDLTNSQPSLVYPFFSSHFQLPIAPGEQIAVFYEDFTFQSFSSLGKWLTRFHEGTFVEDVNYTHSDRSKDPNLIPATTRLSQTENNNQQQVIPNFPNGGGTSDSFTLSLSSSNRNPFDEIIQNSSAFKIMKPEPVPRWIKRPQEFVLQGMNNSLIVLGDDRNGPALRVSGSASEELDKVGFAGSIDLVCGRGRSGMPYSQNNNPGTTNPLVVQNSRQTLETNKVSRPRNPTEGNVDLENDAARLTVAMNSKMDQKLKTQHNTDSSKGFVYPDNVRRPVQPEPSSSAGHNNSYVVAKADHLRFVARKQTNPVNINGSVLILREGTKDEDLSFVYLEGGKIQVEAKEIYFGKSTEKNEPYIKYSVYESHINELKAQIKALADQVNSITSVYKLAFENSIAIPFSPIATLVSSGPTVAQSTTTVVQLVKQRVDTIHPVDAKSEKIFGE